MHICDKYCAAVQSLYNTPGYNTDLDITWYAVAPIFFTMEFYKGIIEK